MQRKRRILKTYFKLTAIEAEELIMYINSHFLLNNHTKIKFPCRVNGEAAKFIRKFSSRKNSLSSFNGPPDRRLVK